MLTTFSSCNREAIQSLEKENEELMKDNTLAGSLQNQSQVIQQPCLIFHLLHL